MLKWANKNPGYILILLIAISFVYANGFKIINLPPSSIHQWRQSDCLAYAKTYYQKGTGLFTPSTYNLAGKDGRVVSEFPIIYYLAGNLFHVFGVHYLILRGLTFICFLLGLYYLYKCLSLFIKSNLLSVYPIIILATSPFYYYYAVNYLPNVPAFSFSFAAFYYLLLYGRSEKNSHIAYATLFLILSTLLKPTDGGLLWVAYLGVIFVQLLQRKVSTRVFIGTAISTVLILASIYGWYKFGVWYNDLNGNHQNLQSIYPIWTMSDKDATWVWESRILDFWAASYQQRTVLYMLGAFVLIFFVQIHKLNPFLRSITIFSFLATVAYDILWYKAFSDHDYYQLANIIPCVLLMITVLEWYCNRIEDKLPAEAKAGVGLVLGGLIVISIYHNKQIQHERYTKAEFQYTKPDIYDAEPYLRQLGIGPSDAIVSVPDPSPNITLAAYGTQGYTESFNDDHFNIVQFKAVGAKYLIINDTSYIHKPLYAPYTTKLLGAFRGKLFVYDLR